MKNWSNQSKINENQARNQLEKNKVEKKLWKIKLYKIFRKITYTYYLYLLVFRDIITYKYLSEYFF